jgi:hypothetical protein
VGTGTRVWRAEPASGRRPPRGCGQLVRHALAPRPARRRRT